MASKYPRVGVPRDPELEAALADTRDLLDDAETRSAAAHVRALALRQARLLREENQDPAAELRRRLQEKYNLIPATADPRTLRMPEGEIDPDDPTPMSDALRWVRGKE